MFNETQKVVQIAYQGMRKTSKDWFNDLQDQLAITNPSGWDKGNFNFSWNEEFVTQREFYSRLTKSEYVWKFSKL